MNPSVALIERPPAGAIRKSLLSSRREIAAMFSGLKPIGAWIRERPRSQDEINDRKLFELGLHALAKWIADEMIALTDPAIDNAVLPARITPMKDISNVLSAYYAEELVRAVSDLHDADEQLRALRLQVSEILADLDQVRRLYGKPPGPSPHLDLYELFVNMMREIEELLPCQS